MTQVHSVVIGSWCKDHKENKNKLGYFTDPV